MRIMNKNIYLDYEKGLKEIPLNILYAISSK
jgi:hypothetical protein